MKTRLRQIAALTAVGFLGSCGGGTVIEEPIPDNVVASVTIGAPATTIAPGTTVQLTAAAKNAAGTTISGSTAATWTSSNQSVATVSTSGLVSAVANGSSTITATMSGKTGNVVITVQTITPVAAATVEASTVNIFAPNQVDITVGGTVTWQFQAIAHNVTFGTTSGAPANIGDTANGNVTRTFSTVGSFAYACTLHPGMSATVIVH